MEFEGEAKPPGKIGELFAGLGEEVDGGAHPGESDVRRAVDSGGEDVEERRPLEALHDVDVNDMNPVAAMEGLEDGLVGGEMGEFDERGNVVENLKR